jgi:hypothetical protein
MGAGARYHPSLAAESAVGLRPPVPVFRSGDPEYLAPYRLTATTIPAVTSVIEAIRGTKSLDAEQD